MCEKKRDVKLYNVIFPFWMIMLFPITWLVVLPGNFIIDSLVLYIGMKILNIESKKIWYKKHIFKIFCFGLLADAIGAAFMLFMMIGFQIDYGEYEFYLTISALILSAIFIFIFNYYVTFRKADKNIRLRMALLFAIVTAPYTFLVPMSWMY